MPTADLNNQRLKIKEMTPEGGILWGQSWLDAGVGGTSAPSFET